MDAHCATRVVMKGVCAANFRILKTFTIRIMNIGIYRWSISMLPVGHMDRSELTAPANTATWAQKISEGGDRSHLTSEIGAEQLNEL